MASKLDKYTKFVVPGAGFANIGAIVVGIVDNTVIIGITGALTVFAFLYFLSHKDRYG